MGINLDWMTASLYVDMDEITFDYTIDTTDPENPVLNVGGAALPISKDYMTYNGQTYMLPGLTVHAPATDKVYVSHSAWWYLWKLGLV